MIFHKNSRGLIISAMAVYIHTNAQHKYISASTQYTYIHTNTPHRHTYDICTNARHTHKCTTYALTHDIFTNARHTHNIRTKYAQTYVRTHDIRTNVRHMHQLMTYAPLARYTQQRTTYATTHQRIYAPTHIRTNITGADGNVAVYSGGYYENVT